MRIGVVGILTYKDNFLCQKTSFMDAPWYDALKAIKTEKLQKIMPNILYSKFFGEVTKSASMTRLKIVLIKDPKKKGTH